MTHIDQLLFHHIFSEKTRQNGSLLKYCAVKMTIHQPHQPHQPHHLSTVQILVNKLQDLFLIAFNPFQKVDVVETFQVTDDPVNDLVGKNIISFINGSLLFKIISRLSAGKRKLG
jgi:hypothetical protein